MSHVCVYRADNQIFVSLVMIYVRMYFFRQKFKHVIAQQEKEKPGFSLSRTFTTAPTALRHRFTRDPGREELVTGSTAAPSNGSAHTAPKKQKGKGPINKDMIKRIDGGGVGLVNPMGWYDGTPMATPMPTPMTSGPGTPRRSISPDHGEAWQQDSHKLNTFVNPPSEPGTSDDSKKRSIDGDSGEDELRTSPTLLSPLDSGGGRLGRVVTNDSVTGTGTALAPPSTEATRRPYAGTAAGDDAFPRSKTIAFDEPDDGFAHELTMGENGRPVYMPRTSTVNAIPWTTTMGSSAFPRTYSMRPQSSRMADPRYTGFGGFPTPLQLISRGFHKAFPTAATKLHETVTMPRTNTIAGRDSIHSGDDRHVPYISFSAVVGRNSKFKGLTEEQMDELGGVEYRALKLLFWIVLCYWIMLPLAGATIIAPYIAADGRYDWVFNSQYKHIRIPWYAFFQAYSGFANLGMSLADQSLLQFQKAYLMNFVVALLILFGNTCYPILLRFIIWVMWKTVPANSSMRESLKFLLDHPRRCFVYLFPSTTTWFLVVVVLFLTCIDFFTFMVLDIGTPAVEAIPIGTRVAAGFFQSVAVRAAGFAIVPMNNIAPSVKVMFVIMMYISVYPIAMSVRSTNVYEERSLGLFDEDEDEDELEEEEEEIGKQVGANAVAKYLGFHARRQLAFDMWWIVGALFLTCIIERPNLNDKAKWEYMNMFNIIFELVSAYGTVGLSLGVTYDNFSLVGGMRKLSKLVIIIVMLRGRHRGLPVAIDRAVMLPKELEQAEEAAIGDRLRRMRSRMSFSQASGMTGFPRTYTDMTNATTRRQGSMDSDPDKGQAGQAGMPRPRGRTTSQSNMSPQSAMQPLQRDTSPSVTRPTRRDSSPSMARFDASASGPKRGHQRSLSSGASSMDSPVANPAALSLALAKLQADPTPPIASKLSNLPGLSPLVESEFSRRGTVAEPEQMTPVSPAKQASPTLGHKLDRAYTSHST
jgi:Trk-type K+ transport system membrane component